MDFVKLTNENYYSAEANKYYMSVSQFKDFNGTLGHAPCEFRAFEKLEGRWSEPPTDALLIGSYVDSYFEGTLDKFKLEHPEIFTQTGELYAKYKHAEYIIERVKKDELFMQYMSGQKQVIMTGQIGGEAWKIKMDSYHPGKAIVDLKVVKAVDGKDSEEWIPDYGRAPWYIFWNYDIQGAVYQEIVRQNTGKKLPFYLAAVSKQKEPSIQVGQIPQSRLDDALSIVEANLPRVMDIKNGYIKPDRCEDCDCCRRTRILHKPIIFA